MTTLFRKKPAPLLGIDISTSAVRLIELSASGGSYRVEAYAAEPLPAGVVVDQTIRDGTQLSQVVARVVQRSRSRIKQVALAVPAASVITKVIEVDKLPTDIEQEHLIQLEAAPHIPYPLEEVALDFDILGPSAQQADRLQVMLAASRREDIEAREDALLSAGLEAQLVDVESLVVERALSLVAHQYDTAPGKTLALIDIGHRQMTLSVLQDRHTLYRRQQPLAGPQPTEAAQHKDAISAAAAVPLLLAPEAAHSDPQDSERLASFVPTLIEAVQQNLKYFHATSAPRTIDTILLAGSLAALPSLVEQLAQATDTATFRVDPVSGLDSAPAVNRQQLINDSPALLVACGLALRSFAHGHR